MRDMWSQTDAVIGGRDVDGEHHELVGYPISKRLTERVSAADIHRVRTQCAAGTDHITDRAAAGAARHWRRRNRAIDHDGKTRPRPRIEQAQRFRNAGYYANTGQVKVFERRSGDDAHCVVLAKHVTEADNDHLASQ